MALTLRKEGPKMKTAAVIEKMIKYSEGNLHDIAHFMKVWGFAKILGEMEDLDPAQQELVEITAIVHDIACPLCREKYGSCPGNLQEQEGPALVREFLEEFVFSSKFVERVCWLVGHHHTYDGVDGIDYQILLEADFLVNADEGKASPEAIRKMYEKVFRTHGGRKLLKAMYNI